MDGARILAYVTGTVDQELLGRNGYLAAGNHQGKGNVLLFPRATDAARGTRALPRAVGRASTLLSS